MLQFKRIHHVHVHVHDPAIPPLKVGIVIAITIPRYLSVHISPESIPFRVPQQQGLESASTAKPGWLTKIQRVQKESPKLYFPETFLPSFTRNG
jgi:hypothetical protein